VFYLKIQILSISILIILLGGCPVNSNKDMYDEETINKAKFTAENFIYTNFKEITTL